MQCNLVESKLRLHLSLIQNDRILTNLIIGFYLPRANFTYINKKTGHYKSFKNNENVVKECFARQLKQTCLRIFNPLHQ